MSTRGEQSLRRRAREHGLRLEKSRVKNPHGDNFGRYRLVNIEHNCVLAGSKWELTLDEVAEFLAPNPDIRPEYLEPVATAEITREMVEASREVPYRVITIIPYADKPLQNTYILMHHELDLWLSDYAEHAERIIRIEAGVMQVDDDGVHTAHFPSSGEYVDLERQN